MFTRISLTWHPSALQVVQTQSDDDEEDANPLVVSLHRKHALVQPTSQSSLVFGSYTASVLRPKQLPKAFGCCLCHCLGRAVPNISCANPIATSCIYQDSNLTSCKLSHAPLCLPKSPNHPPALNHLLLTSPLHGQGNPFLQTTVPHNISCTTFQLQQPLGPGKSASLASYGVYTKLLSPRPAEIAQADPQRVVFTGSHLVPSPYQIASQLTTVRFLGSRQSSKQFHLSSTMAGCAQGDHEFLSCKPLYPEPALPKTARS